MASPAHAPVQPTAERAPAIVSRRSVLDRTLRTVGFELIFHDGAAGTETWRGELNSARHPAYLSVTPQYLVECEPLPLEPASVVLEVAPLPRSTAACSSALPRCASRAFASCSTTSATTPRSSRCLPTPTS